jgi:hypothetical protein
MKHLSLDRCRSLLGTKYIGRDRKGAIPIESMEGREVLDRSIIRGRTGVLLVATMLALHPRSSRQAAQTTMVRHLLAGMLGCCGRLMHVSVMGVCGRQINGIVMGVCGMLMHGSVMGGVGAQGGEATRLVLMAVGVRIQRTRLLLIGGEIRDTLGAPGMGLATKWSI